MKRIVVLILVLLFCIPACACALSPFETSSGAFQWHMSDIIEQYIDWRVISSKDEFTLLCGESETLPVIFITEDIDDNLYEIVVAGMFPPVYSAETDAMLENFLNTASTATHTLALLERLEISQDIRVLNRNVMYQVLNEARKSQSMDFLLEEPVFINQHVLSYSYTHELDYDEELDLIYYSLLITHD